MISLELLRATLRRQGLSQVLLAKVVGVKRDSLSSGQMTPEKQAEVEDALGLERNALSLEPAARAPRDFDFIDALAFERMLIHRGISRREAARRLRVTLEEYYLWCVACRETPPEGWRLIVESEFVLEDGALRVWQP